MTNEEKRSILFLCSLTIIVLTIIAGLFSYHINSMKVNDIMKEHLFYLLAIIFIFSLLIATFLCISVVKEIISYEKLKLKKEMLAKPKTEPEP